MRVWAHIIIAVLGAALVWFGFHPDYSVFGGSLWLPVAAVAMGALLIGNSVMGLIPHHRSHRSAYWRNWGQEIRERIFWGLVGLGVFAVGQSVAQIGDDIAFAFVGMLLAGGGLVVAVIASAMVTYKVVQSQPWRYRARVSTTVELEEA